MSARKPAGVSLAGRYYALSACSTGSAFLLFCIDAALTPPAVFLLFTSGLFMAFAHVTGRDAWGAAHAASGLQALTGGDLDGMAAAHARVPPHSMRRGTVARSIAIQKAMAALFGGSADGVIGAIAPALAPGQRLTTRTVERMQMASAHGVRAVAHAMRGDATHAHQDATAAESFDEALPDAIARAALARTLIVARGADLAALTAHLTKNGSLMLEHTMPRERALVRALRKMARGRARSVYREPAKPTDSPGVPSPLADWIAQMVPEAAAYVAEDARTELVAPALRPTEDAAQVALAQRAAKLATLARRARQISVGVIAALALAPLVKIMFDASAHPAMTPASGPAMASSLPFDPWMMLVSFVAMVLVLGGVASKVASAQRFDLALIRAARAAALSDAQAADHLLTKAKRSSMRVLAAAAGAAVAALAEQRADFTSCIRECDLAIAQLTTRRRGPASDQLLPHLLALRSLALAAKGRSTDAEAELAKVQKRYPEYMLLALFDFRIRLANAVRKGDLEEAHRVALQRTIDLPLPLRDDLLTDVVLAVSPTGLSQEEMQRVDAELRVDPAIRSWIDAIAPGLREQMVAALHRGEGKPLTFGA